MRPLTKIGLVATGFILAFALATTVVAVHIAATSGPDRQQYAAMFDFGDSLLFLAVFGVASVFPGGAALFFLRPYRGFWRALSIAASTVAATAGAALVADIATRGSEAHVAGAWFALAGLRMMLAPLFSLAFLASAVFAPSRGFRVALLIATVLEALAFSRFALFLLPPLRPH